MLCLLALNLFVPIANRPANAQTPADLEAARRQAQILQKQELERARRDMERSLPAERDPHGIDTRQLAPKAAADTATQGCHFIREILIEDAPRLPESARREIGERFAGRCLGITEIEAILGEITRAYMLQGLITVRAYLPAQDLGSGRLRITVIEGKVSEIRIDDGGRKSVSIGNAFPGIVGEVLDLRRLEQGIDQINRLASNNASMDIEPGERAGESVIVIRNQPRPRLHFNIGYDNQGASTTGRHQTGATLSIDNPLLFNDFLAYTHRETTPGERGHRFSGSDNLVYSIPFGYSTATLGWNRSRYATPIHLPSGLELVSSGNSTVSFLTLDRVVHRDQARKATLSATLSSKDSRNYLDDNFLFVGSRKLSLLDLDASLSSLLGGGVVQVNAGLTRGLGIMGAKQDAGGLPDSAPRAQFLKYRAGMNYTQSFRLAQRDAQFSSQLSAQYARDTLYGSEQMLIGGLYTVRGFSERTLSGDHGYYWRNELSTRIPIKAGDEVLSGRAFIAYDFGRVYNRAPGVPSGRLTGAAAGFSIAWQGASWEWSCTRPLSGPSGMTRDGTQAWFRVSFAL